MVCPLLPELLSSCLANKAYSRIIGAFALYINNKVIHREIFLINEMLSKHIGGLPGQLRLSLLRIE
jgi:hypothetical protein